MMRKMMMRAMMMRKMMIMGAEIFRWKYLLFA